MRVATWNLEKPAGNKGARQDRQREWIEKVTADVWVFTESHVTVSPGPDFTGVCSPHEESGRVWTAIWSRLPIEPLVATGDPTRTACARVTPRRGPPVVVFGSVLPWLGSRWEGKPSAGGVAFQAALSAQRQDWAELRRRHPDCEFILAGDLNQDLSVKHFYGSNTNRAALQAALQATGLQCLTAGQSDPAWMQTQGQWASVDHICASEGLAARVMAPATCWPQGDRPDKSLSDHFGVVVEFG